MTCRESKHQVHETMTTRVEIATGYVRRMVENETRGWGDMDNALDRLEVRYALPRWTLNNLRTGRSKTVEASLFDRIKAAFVDHCGKQAARLLHEADMAQEANPNVDVADIQREIRALQARLEAAKTARTVK